MPIESVTIRIDDVDEANDFMRVYIGAHGHPVRISRFRELMEGKGLNNVDPEHLIRNVAIRAALGNANRNDIAAIKAAVEGVTFRV